MAVGNTFGATALSSYGGFWISFAIILTPGGFEIVSTLEAESPAPFLNSFGLYLMGWFIFTFLLLICTLRSTVAFFLLFFTLDLAFLLLGIGYLEADANGPNSACIKGGGYFGLFAAFLAWYNALAGIADNSNRSVICTAQCHPVHALTALQLLRHPRRALPVERQGPRDAPGQGQRHRLLGRPHCVSSSRTHQNKKTTQAARPPLPVRRKLWDLELDNDCYCMLRADRRKFPRR